MNNNLIIIGSSTGGPKVLNEMFSAFPTLNATIIIVQHVPPKFDKAIAERLNDISKINVKMAEEGEMLKNGTAYMAQSRKHLRLVKNSHLALTEEAKVNCCCPSVDVAMMSVNKNSKRKIVGVLLTGLGRDGATGMEHIKGIGGTTIAQDQKSCVIFGMPRVAIATGKVDHIMPPEEICKQLVNIVGTI